MPMYSYRCECGTKFDRYLAVADYRQPQTCECGRTAERVICAPFVQAEIPSYQSPIDGRTISSRSQRREDLARSGCVEYEPSMKEAAERRKVSEDAALDKKVDQIVEQEIYAMPTKKREKLAAELDGGMDVQVTRA